MKDDELLTPEGMDRIAEQYENTLRSKQNDLVAEVKKARDFEIYTCLKTLKNYSNTERNFVANYLLDLLEKEML